MSSISNVLQSEALVARAGDESASGPVLRSERTDLQLVEAVIAGDEGAFEQIFDRYKRLVAVTAARYFRRPEQIEEIIQIAFAKAYIELARFRGQHELSLASWLGRIAANSSLDGLRKRRRKPENLCCELTDKDIESLHQVAQKTDECAETILVRRDLAGKLLANLPDDDRALLKMLYADEMSVAEIAELLGWSVSKVKIRAWRARKTMRKVLKRFM